MFRWLAITCGVVLFAVIVAAVGFIGVLHYFGRELPDYQQLADYELPVTTRVYASDGQLTKDYSVENRIFTPIHLIPSLVGQAFLASEDKNFYHHPGIDPQGMLRAVLNNAINRGKKRPEGASTITQQVAKNFFLSNEISVKRKIKEAILSFRIEKALTKDRILELYLNKIYFGYGAFGVTSAALNYFDKTLEELTLAEIAYLAALPKAPGNYHPVHNYEAAINRRNYVLGRMADAGFVTQAEAKKAAVEPIQIVEKVPQKYKSAEYYNEEVRRFLIERYGMPGLYGGGLCVRTPLDLELQTYADDALRFGLVEYDRRHGWRGPIKNVGKISDWQKQLKEVPNPGLGTTWRMAIVLGNVAGGTEIGLVDGTKGTIPPALRWGSIKPGDVVPVELKKEDAKGKELPENTYQLHQIPKVNGGFVALDPHTGRIYAVAGGFSYEASEFNRATQAMRQTGSAFKPFIYLTAFENGLTPSDTIMDSPVSIHIGQGLPNYTPTNYGGQYYGQVTLRKALEKSMNSAAVRLMQKVGVEKVAAMGDRLGIADHMPRRFSIALGAQETTPLRMAGAFAIVVNGGKKVTPTFIDAIQDRHGKTIYRHDGRLCPGCVGEWRDQPVPVLQDTREQILNPMTAYQLVNVMEGVIKRGTAVRLKDFPHPLAGKTGTSTGFREAWFPCYTPNLVTVCYIGMDDHSPNGNGETGSKAALPITKYFLERALKDVQPVAFRIPEGIQMVPTDPTTGQMTNFNDENAVYEPYIQGGVNEEDQFGKPMNNLGNIGENKYVPESQTPMVMEEQKVLEPADKSKSFDKLWQENMEQDGDLSGDLGPQDGLY